MSLPTWGAWIEIMDWGSARPYAVRRSLLGERGLKCIGRVLRHQITESLPTWGVQGHAGEFDLHGFYFERFFYFEGILL